MASPHNRSNVWALGFHEGVGTVSLAGADGRRGPGCWGQEVQCPQGQPGPAEVQERLAGGAGLLQGEWRAMWLEKPDGKVGPRLVGRGRAGRGLVGKGFLRLVLRGQ